MQIMQEGQQLGYLFEIGLGIVSSDSRRFVLTLSQSWGVISSCAIKQTISEEVNRKWWVAKGEFFFLSNQESTFLITRQKLEEENEGEKNTDRKVIDFLADLSVKHQEGRYWLVFHRSFLTYLRSWQIHLSHRDEQGKQQGARFNVMLTATSRKSTLKPPVLFLKWLIFDTPDAESSQSSFLK